MKRHQLQLGNVHAKLWRPDLGIIALVLLAFAVACGAPAPTPTPTATPLPTPPPTSTPAPALITAGLGDDTEAFFQAIPTSERDCMAQAFATENLVELIGTRPPSQEDWAKLTGCLSEDTARRMTLGHMMIDLGISEQDITCIADEFGDVSYLDGMGQVPGEQSTQGSTFMFKVFRGALNCLSEEAAARMFGDMEEGGGPGMEQFKCLFESADDETIAKLFAMGPGGGEGAAPPQELLDLIARCGPIPGPSVEGPDEGSGPPELTPEQRDCVIEAIGETAFSELFSGQRPPNQEELQRIEACEVPIGPASGG